MKHKVRTLVVLGLVLALAVSLITVFAVADYNDNMVVFDYNGSRDKACFEFRGFEPYGDNHYPNLFENETFRGMMPGDITQPQDIRLKVEDLGEGYVEMYLHAESAHPENNDISPEEYANYEKLLEFLNITVTDSDTGAVIATEKTLVVGEEAIYLGKFRDGDLRDLEIVAELDILADNSVANLHAEIAWVFTAYIYPGDPITPVGPSKPALDKGGHYAYIIGYPDGLVHPELQITRAESVTIFFRMLLEESRQKYWSQTNPYYDVAPDDWYNNAISTMTNAGIVEGYPNGNFLPNSNITRAEFAALAVRFFEGDGETNGTDAFPDIKGHWANYEINLAYAKKLIEGYPDGTFKPDQEITRAEAMTIVNRVLERYPHKDHLLEDMIVWPDNMDETMWYYEDVQEATNSHTFVTKRDENNDPYEIWQTLLPVRDWEALEKEWSEYNSSRNPGEVVSSKDAAVFR